jgi:hydrogenase expression/formation protein HypC
MCLGIPGKVLSIELDELPVGRVAFGGIVKRVCLAYAPEATVGDYVIVHAGFAICVVDANAAKRALDYLAELGALEELAQAAPEKAGVG